MTDEKKFYQLSAAERREVLKASGLCSDEDLSVLSGETGLDEETADHMIENVIGRFTFPMGLAQHFVINGKAYPIPMVVEEPSVVAAASNGARIAAKCGGFSAEADAPRMIGQLQILGVNPDEAAAALEAHREELLRCAAEAQPRLTARGGGPVDIQFRKFPESECGPMLVVHLILDVRDAMGANAVNTALEALSPLAASISGGEVRLKILSNLADQRLARARCVISCEALAFRTFSGEEVRDRILQAAAFAEADPYRAVTHNKGIMNGIDAMALAVGNDWRAIESGAHSWAAVSGKIKPLSHWRKDEAGNLCGMIELPLAVGTVGGATRSNPCAAVGLKLTGITDAQELASVMAAVGLAQNLAALKALATEGIQRGHMSLHARQLALSAGATGPQVDEIAAVMIRENRISASYAEEIYQKMNSSLL